jgi:hypothetical protein
LNERRDEALTHGGHFLPFPAGDPSDVLARPPDRPSAGTGQPMIVENRPGDRAVVQGRWPNTGEIAQTRPYYLSG